MRRLYQNRWLRRVERMGGLNSARRFATVEIKSSRRSAYINAGKIRALSGALIYSS